MLGVLVRMAAHICVYASRGFHVTTIPISHRNLCRRTIIIDFSQARHLRLRKRKDLTKKKGKKKNQNKFMFQLDQNLCLLGLLPQ